MFEARLPGGKHSQRVLEFGSESAVDYKLMEAIVYCRGPLLSQGLTLQEMANAAESFNQKLRPKVTLRLVGQQVHLRRMRSYQISWQMICF